MPEKVFYADKNKLSLMREGQARAIDIFGSDLPGRVALVPKSDADRLAEALRTITAPVDGSVPITPIGEWMTEARAALAAYDGGEDGGT